ncbi:uncharacterized protein LOC125646501 isoform X2 [Ostrea edulis]|uniref:uncharacterized protein LOC125646501 isoform X2 n=1 Tax=Ostrea edulis TaxID=37623 RepID=UPI002094AE68|nr:uncharacterized protein LOC125646501 isoform X2 [Ostrea edulis]
MKIPVLFRATLLVFIAWSDGVLVDFRRLCQSEQQSFGVRRDPWQNDAIHYCFMTGNLNEECKQINVTGGIDCGEEFYLQGGLPDETAECCRKFEHRLTNCQILTQTFSYQGGFDIMYINRALRKIISTPTGSDPTAFQVELCDLEKLGT